MRRILVSSLVILAIGAAGCSSSAGSSESSSANTSSGSITTVTDYEGGATTSDPQDYAAAAEGIFTKYHLKVNFVPISGETSAEVEAVAASKSDLAFTWGDIADEMLIAAQNPSAPPLISISAGEDLNPVALFFLKSSGIKKPSDLIGKTIGVASGSLSAEYLVAFLRAEGIPENKVTIETMDSSAQGPALLGNKVDAIAEFVRGLGSLTVLGKERGEQIGAFMFGKLGIASPLSGVIVQKRLVDEDPAVAKEIAEAETAAIYFCLTNEDKCIRDFVAANAGFSYADSIAEWRVAVADTFGGLSPATVAKMNPLQVGWMDPALVAKTVPELEALFDIKKQFNPTTLYTNQFVERP